jgi:hypothetical protein
MLCTLKMYLKRGINLRECYFWSGAWPWSRVNPPS